jgi:hypothetical protein
VGGSRTLSIRLSISLNVEARDSVTRESSCPRGANDARHRQLGMRLGRGAGLLSLSEGQPRLSSSRCSCKAVENGPSLAPTPRTLVGRARVRERKEGWSEQASRLTAPRRRRGKHLGESPASAALPWRVLIHGVTV